MQCARTTDLVGLLDRSEDCVHQKMFRILRMQVQYKIVVESNDNSEYQYSQTGKRPFYRISFFCGVCVVKGRKNVLRTLSLYIFEFRTRSSYVFCFIFYFLNPEYYINKHKVYSIFFCMKEYMHNMHCIYTSTHVYTVQCSSSKKRTQL